MTLDLSEYKNYNIVSEEEMYHNNYYIHHCNSTMNYKLENPEFGTIIWEVIFEPMTEDLTIQIENNIVDVFERWLPFVELRNIDIENKNELSQTKINIEFNIRRAPNSLESVQVTFDGVGGGSSTNTGGGATAGATAGASGGGGGY